MEKDSPIQRERWRERRAKEEHHRVFDFVPLGVDLAVVAGVVVSVGFGFDFGFGFGFPPPAAAVVGRAPLTRAFVSPAAGGGLPAVSAVLTLRVEAGVAVGFPWAFMDAVAACRSPPLALLEVAAGAPTTWEA